MMRQKPYDKTYDKILVDAPCSGLGVMRHKPEKLSILKANNILSH